MQWILGCLSKFVGLLARIFGVTPDSIKEERDKNPSPTREN